MTKPVVSRSAEDYLKAILQLESSSGGVSTSAIAAQLGLSQPSVTRMTKKLAADGLVVRVPYRGVTLTDTGRRVALEVLRHHRLLELFLSDSLGMPLDEVHAEADRLEHVLSDELESRIDAALGYPTHDPHGHPIPDSELRLDTVSRRSLSEVAPGERAVVARVPDRDADLLRYLGELELVPGAEVEVLSAAPFGGPITLRSAAGEHAIARELAGAIAVV
jgi:DtxR family transcriptional regulator, Mn-dependent transcriptional regulator